MDMGPERGEGQRKQPKFYKDEMSYFFPWQHNLRTPGCMLAAPSVQKTGFDTAYSKL